MDALIAVYGAVKLGVAAVTGLELDRDSESCFPEGDAIEDVEDEGTGSSSSECSGSVLSSVASSESGDTDLSKSSMSMTSVVVQALLHQQEAQEAAKVLLSQFIVDDHEYHHHILGGTPISRLGLKPIQLLLNVGLPRHDMRVRS